MSKHLLKFDTEAAYQTAKRNHLLVPNVSLVASPYNVHVNSAIVSMGDAVAGDIIAYDLSGNQKVIKAEAWDSVKSKGYTPEAIVVVPASHTNGDVKAMSVHFMDAENAASGSTSEKTLAWGPYEMNDDVADLTNYTSVVCGADGNINPTISTYESAIMPSDAFYYGSAEDKGSEYRQDGVSCFKSGMQYYYPSDEFYIPCPYLENGSPNPRFYSPGVSNVMNEFGKGATNTNVLYNLMSNDGQLAKRKSILASGVTRNSEGGTTTISGNAITVWALTKCFGAKAEGTAEGTSYNPHGKYIKFVLATDGLYYGVAGFSYNPITLYENEFIWATWTSGKKGTDYFYTYPAALATKLYGTSHVTAGNWFLPDAAQLALVMPYKDRIKYALTTLTSDYAAPWINSRLWSSSEYSNNYAWDLNPSDGSVEYYNKYLSNRVRAFAAFNA